MGGGVHPWNIILHQWVVEKAPIIGFGSIQGWESGASLSLPLSFSLSLARSISLSLTLTLFFFSFFRSFFRSFFSFREQISKLLGGQLPPLPPRVARPWDKWSVTLWSFSDLSHASGVLEPGLVFPVVSPACHCHVVLSRVLQYRCTRFYYNIRHWCYITYWLDWQVTVGPCGFEWHITGHNGT